MLIRALIPLVSVLVVGCSYAPVHHGEMLGSDQNASTASSEQSVSAVQSVVAVSGESLAEKPSITVEDLVRFTTIGDPHTLDWNDADSIEAPGVFSPDREHVAVLIRHGNLQRETNDGTLLVYRTSELFHGAHPKVVAAFASATNSQPIAHIRWLADSASLVFAGTRETELPQVFRVNILTGEITQLTQLSERLAWYDITPSGERLVTLSVQPTSPPADDPLCRHRGCLVQSQAIWDAENGGPLWATQLSVHELRSGSVRVIEGARDTAIDRCSDRLEGGISPDGKFALRVCMLKGMHDVPSWWREYTAAPTLLKCLRIRNHVCGQRLMRVDLESGVTIGLGDAPYVPDFTAQPLWIDGGRRFILPAALETLTGIQSNERAQRLASGSALLVDARTGETSRIGRLDARVAHVSGAIWDQKADTLMIETQDEMHVALPALHFRLRGKHWSKVPANFPVTTDGRSAHAEIDLLLEQSLNQAPILMATDAKHDAKVRVLDPNPWLGDRAVGRVESIVWKSKDGQMWHGGLYYPPHYESAKRYPLLIQTHGFKPTEFSLHGGIARNFPGQALAAHDIVVLQVKERIADVANTPAEWPAVQAGYEGAIDHLTALHLIDPNRVGIQGWSRTGPHMGFLLTHSSYPIAAAAMTSSGDFGWLFYMLAGAPELYEFANGGPPFGDGLTSWLRYVPTFNLEHVKAPMLMWENRDVAGLWDWYAGLRRLQKPVEYWFLPDGVHDVFKVPERLMTTQLLVDWFRFWLKDEEDLDPKKADQYARWRQLREQHEAAAP